MIKLAICDDCMKTANQLETMILEMPGGQLKTEIFSDGRQLLKYIHANGPCFQIYLLDIEMPGVNGIETAAEIRSQDKDAVILFVTDYEEYVYEVFEVLPFRFIRKPVTMENVLPALQSAVEHIRSWGKFFFFQMGRDQYQVPYRDILWFEGHGRKVILHTEKSEYSFYFKISTVEAALDSTYFVRIHASYMVNMEAIRAVRNETVELKGLVSLPVSKKYRKTVRERHLEFTGRKCGK